MTMDMGFSPPYGAPPMQLDRAQLGPRQFNADVSLANIPEGSSGRHCLKVSLPTNVLTCPIENFDEFSAQMRALAGSGGATATPITFDLPNSWRVTISRVAAKRENPYLRVAVEIVDPKNSKNNQIIASPRIELERVCQVLKGTPEPIEGSIGISVLAITPAPEPQSRGGLFGLLERARRRPN